ncbi:transposase [Photobacterium frigidiphilum]
MIWAGKEIRPRAILQQQFEYAYLFGAVCIQTGETETIVVPHSNMEARREQLRFISEATPSDKYPIVIMGQASWHQAHLAKEFKNATLIHLPPYSSELNSIKQVWQWMRQHELANRCFENYNDIVDSVSRA